MISQLNDLVDCSKQMQTSCGILNCWWYPLVMDVSGVRCRLGISIMSLIIIIIIIKITNL